VCNLLRCGQGQGKRGVIVQTAARPALGRNGTWFQTEKGSQLQSQEGEIESRNPKVFKDETQGRSAPTPKQPKQKRNICKIEGEKGKPKFGRGTINTSLRGVTEPNLPLAEGGGYIWGGTRGALAQRENSTYHVPSRKGRKTLVAIRTQVSPNQPKEPRARKV